jgi:hypothetical protein
VDEAGLAMMLMALRDGLRTWKGIDWEVLNGLHKNGVSVRSSQGASWWAAA